MNRPTWCATLIALAIGLSGCATTMQTPGVERSGFLEDYSMLHPGAEGQPQLVWVDPTADFSRYDSVLINPVLVVPAPSSRLHVSSHDSVRLATTLEEDLNRELSQILTIAEEPGPRTMRLRVAITEARRSRPLADFASTILLPLRLLSLGNRLATGTHAFVGRAAVEAEMVDSISGTRLMAAVDERAGSKALRGSLRAWSDVDEAYALWASRLRERLVELRRPRSAAP